MHDDWIHLRSELSGIVRDPIRGIRPADVLLRVSPPGLAITTPRAAAFRRLLRSLVAAATWGGEVDALHLSASWDVGEAGGRCGLRLGVWSRRRETDHQAGSGWDGIETALLADVRRHLDKVGGGALEIESRGRGQLACELRLDAVHPAWEGTVESFLAAFAPSTPAA